MPRSSGLKLGPLVPISSRSRTPNTYAAFKRIETMISTILVKKSTIPPIPMPRSSGLKHNFRTVGGRVAAAPNTYAAFKRIETNLGFLLDPGLQKPPIPMPRSSGLKRKSGCFSRRGEAGPPIPLPRSSGLKPNPRSNPPVQSFPQYLCRVQAD